MGFIFDREWLQKNADRDDNLEIAAGSLSLDQIPPTARDPANRTEVPAFGRLVNLSRRQRGWTIEGLASFACIDLAEAIRIEHDESYVPGPRTVYQLSNALGLPRERMLQLSGT